MLMDESLTSETLVARALVGRSEAQLRHDILPESDERRSSGKILHVRFNSHPKRRWDRVTCPRTSANFVRSQI